MGQSLNLAKSKILVVDDSPQSMDIITAILLGFGVTRASKCQDVEEAKDLLCKDAFSLALLDDEMPAQDGYDLTGWIRSQPNAPYFTIPVILASGNPSSAKVARARDAGANCVIAKPITPATLLRQMEWLARSKRVFVQSESYSGPDRRFQVRGLPDGIEERRREALALMQTPDRDLSQDEINALFG